jgi:uncharacterized protein YndB with AHSA1/START domain
MTDDTALLGSLRVVDGAGVVRISERFAVGTDDLWGALTEPDRLMGWFGEVEGERAPGKELRVNITLSGRRTATVEACEPPRRLLLTMRDLEPGPGQPEQTGLEVQLTADGDQTRLVWEESGLPLHLLAAYGAGIQIHVEHLIDYVSGREMRDVEARWGELLPAYEALGVS